MTLVASKLGWGLLFVNVGCVWLPTQKYNTRYCNLVAIHSSCMYFYNSWTQFTEEEFTLRTKENHDHHCTLLDGPLAAFNSTTYGVNHSSTLNEIDYFHVVGGQLPQDIMHVLYEGVLPLNVRHMLHRFVCEEKLFSLQALHDRIVSFPYGRYEARNKPPKRIEITHLKGASKLPFSGTWIDVSQIIVKSVFNTCITRT